MTRKQEPDQPPEQRHQATLRYGRAWVALAAALAVHVTDEALTNFLAVYNPTVRAIRGRFDKLTAGDPALQIRLGTCVIGKVGFLLNPDPADEVTTNEHQLTLMNGIGCILSSYQLHLMGERISWFKGHVAH